MRLSRVLPLILAAAILGLTVFALMVSGVTDLVTMERDPARKQFDAVLDSLDWLGPGLIMEEQAANGDRLLVWTK